MTDGPHPRAFLFFGFVIRHRRSHEHNLPRTRRRRAGSRRNSRAKRNILRVDPHALIHQLVNSLGMTESAKDLPARIADLAALEELMSRPSPELVQALDQVSGDIMVLGVG